MKCLICQSTEVSVFKTKVKPLEVFIACASCHFVAKHPQHFLSEEAEKNRYQLHTGQNQEGHLQFLKPCQNFILDFYGKNPGAKILDYGCGPVPVLASSLPFSIETFDPFFDPKPLPENNFNLVILTEVIEHFHDPIKELNKIKSIMAQKNSGLLVMTSLIDEIDFELWSYRRDSTHVSFFSELSLKAIGEIFFWDLTRLSKQLFYFESR